MSIYDDLQEVASNVLSDFKQGSIIYLQSTDGGGPDDDPGQPTLNSFEFNGTARGVKFKYVQNGQALSSDLQVTMPVDTRFIPAVKDHIKIDNVTYKIHKILPKPAAGTPVVYTVIVRK